MSILRAITLILLVAVICGPLGAQEITDDTKFIFPAPPEVTIKLRKSSKTSARGKLVSLSKTEAVIKNDRGEQRVAFDRIDSLDSALLKFDGDEPYGEIGSRVKAAFSSVEIVVGANPVPADAHLAASRPAPSDTGTKKPTTVPRNQDPEQMAKIGLRPGGFGGLDNIPKVKPTDAQATTTSEGVSQEPEGVAVSEGDSQVMTCSNCQKKITAADERAGVCPHCKIDFAVTPPPAAANNPYGGAAAAPVNNPFAVAGNNAAPAVGTPGTVPAAIGTPPVVVQSGNGFTFDSIPNWAKGGLFVLLVLVGYHVTFNR
jgi:hypothetical protein